MDKNVKTLKKDLSEISFVEREKIRGRYVGNRCGRDFLYYAFHYLKPDIYNKSNVDHTKLGKQLGLTLPAYMAWTNFQFIRLENVLKEGGFKLKINNVEVGSFFTFLLTILLNISKPFEKVKNKIEENIDNNVVTGIDVSISLSGLLDHVMFVYGYDNDYYYIFDTHQSPKLNYEQVTEEYPFLMKIKKDEVKKRWKMFSRIWEVEKI
jgi:hypothetical protein